MLFVLKPFSWVSCSSVGSFRLMSTPPLSPFYLYLIVLSIHMDDQIDGKTLIGSYVCTERPGEFRWQPGSLTQVFFPFIQSLHVHVLWRRYFVHLNFPIHRLFCMVIGLSLRILTKHHLMCIPTYCRCWREQIHL